MCDNSKESNFHLFILIFEWEFCRRVFFLQKMFSSTAFGRWHWCHFFPISDRWINRNDRRTNRSLHVEWEPMVVESFRISHSLCSAAHSEDWKEYSHSKPNFVHWKWPPIHRPIINRWSSLELTILQLIRRRFIKVIHSFESLHGRRDGNDCFQRICTEHLLQRLILQQFQFKSSATVRTVTSVHRSRSPRTSSIDALFLRFHFQIGNLDSEFTCFGICCAICCFPLGILCCLACRQRRCNFCAATYPWMNNRRLMKSVSLSDIVFLLNYSSVLLRKGQSLK